MIDRYLVLGREGGSEASRARGGGQPGVLEVGQHDNHDCEDGDVGHEDHEDGKLEEAVKGCLCLCLTLE